jgi:hypothetical protein
VCCANCVLKYFYKSRKNVTFVAKNHHGFFNVIHSEQDKKVMRKFNVTGICVPNRHYMVDISQKIEKIYSMVEDGYYFTINRGRQYGKTTTIGRLKKRMPAGYICASISFQYSTPEMFASDEGFF